MSEVILLDTHFAEKHDHDAEKHLFGWTGHKRMKNLDANLWFYREPTQSFQPHPRTLLIDSVVNRYREGLISLGRAAEIAGLPYDKMIDELRDRGMTLRFGPSTIEEAEEDEERLIVSLKKGRST